MAVYSPGSVNEWTVQICTFCVSNNSSGDGSNSDGGGGNGSNRSYRSRSMDSLDRIRNRRSGQSGRGGWSGHQNMWKYHTIGQNIPAGAETMQDIKIRPSSNAESKDSWVSKKRPLVTTLLSRVQDKVHTLAGSSNTTTQGSYDTMGPTRGSTSWAESLTALTLIYISSR